MVDYKRKPVLWIEGTRCLTNPERGVYADLVERMYALEADLYYDERDLAGFCNVTVRTFRNILQGLIKKGKIHVTEDGKLTANHVRTERETAMNIRETYRSRAIHGGKRSGEVRKSKALAEACGSTSPSPSPSPSPINKKDSLTTFGISPDGEPPGKEFDPAKQLFDFGVQLLASYGIKNQKARALIGKWRKVRKDPDLMAILLRAGETRRFDIVPFIEGSLRDQVKRPRSWVEQEREASRQRMDWIRQEAGIDGESGEVPGNSAERDSVPGSPFDPAEGQPLSAGGERLRADDRRSISGPVNGRSVDGNSGIPGDLGQNDLADHGPANPRPNGQHAEAAGAADRKQKQAGPRKARCGPPALRPGPRGDTAGRGELALGLGDEES